MKNRDANDLDLMPEGFLGLKKPDELEFTDITVFTEYRLKGGRCGM